MTKKKKAVPKGDVWIMSISGHAFWTGAGRVNPGEMAECDAAIAETLVAAGMAELIKQTESSDRPDDDGVPE